MRSGTLCSAQVPRHRSREFPSGLLLQTAPALLHSAASSGFSFPQSNRLRWVQSVVERGTERPLLAMMSRVALHEVQQRQEDRHASPPHRSREDWRGTPRTRRCLNPGPGAHLQGTPSATGMTGKGWGPGHSGLHVQLGHQPRGRDGPTLSSAVSKSLLWNPELCQEAPLQGVGTLITERHSF